MKSSLGFPVTPCPLCVFLLSSDQVWEDRNVRITPSPTTLTLGYSARARVQITLSLEKAQTFVESSHPGLEGVCSLGKFISVAVRADGNCFYTASTIGALLWAATQEGPEALQGVLGHFLEVLFDRTTGAARRALPLQLQVRLSTPTVQKRVKTL